MIVFIKRLTLILAIIFVPVFLASFLNGLVVAFSTPVDDGSAQTSIWVITMLLFEAYLKNLWGMLVLTSIGTDFYFYILKGYKKNNLVFYGFKSLSVFLILFFSVLLYYADSFGILKAYELEAMPQYGYGLLLASALPIAGLSIILIYKAHKKWIFPHYLKSEE